MHIVFTHFRAKFIRGESRSSVIRGSDSHCVDGKKRIVD